MIRKLLYLILLLSANHVARGQIRLTDTAYILPYLNICSYSCHYRIAEKYDIALKTPPQGCYLLPHFSPDSIRIRNEILEAYYAKRLGNDWLNKVRSEVYTCESQCCPDDSVKKYTVGGIGGAIGIVMSAYEADLNASQWCIFDQNFLWIFKAYPTVIIRIDMYCHEGDSVMANSRLEKISEHLSIHGIDPKQYNLMNSGTMQGLTYPLDDPRRSQIRGTILQF